MNTEIIVENQHITGLEDAYKRKTWIPSNKSV